MTHNLPDRPNLQQLRNQAKDLLKAQNAGQPEARDRFVAHLSSPKPGVDFKLADALLVVAREYGFPSWPKLKAHVDALETVPVDPAVDLYRAMIRTLRQAESLSVTIDISLLSVQLAETKLTSRRVYLRKPNLARIETSHGDKLADIMIADGATIWKYSPPAGPEKAKTYRRVDAPHGLSTKGREILQAVGLASMLDMAVFHGATDRGVPLRCRESDDDGCDVVELRMKPNSGAVYNCSIDRSDGLPRKMVMEPYGEEQLGMTETWTDVQVDTDLPDSLFQWTPPIDWVQWTEASPDTFIIKAGETAPDVAVRGAQGGMHSLRSQSGDIVVLILLWSIVDEHSRQWAPKLQELHERYSPSGVRIVPVTNFGTESDQLSDFLNEHHLTFSVMRPDSKDCYAVMKDYGVRAAPGFVIVDRKGIVAESWTLDYPRLEGAIQAVLDL